MRTTIALLAALNVLYLLWVLVRPGAAAVPQSVVTVPSLTLMSGDELAEVVANEVATSMHCVELGPFDTADSAEALASEMSRAIRWQVVSRSRQVAVRHRAYVPAVVSGDAEEAGLERVRAVIAELDADIDSYLITGGELDQAVSLGVFGDISNAHRVQRILASQGVEVLVREEPRFQDVYWIQIMTEKPIDFSRESGFGAAFYELMPGQRQNVCETIAQRD